MRALLIALALVLIPVIDCPSPAIVCPPGQQIICVDAGPRSCPTCICK